MMCTYIGYKFCILRSNEGSVYYHKEIKNLVWRLYGKHFLRYKYSVDEYLEELMQYIYSAEQRNTNRLVYTYKTAVITLLGNATLFLLPAVYQLPPAPLICPILLLARVAALSNILYLCVPSL